MEEILVENGLVVRMVADMVDMAEVMEDLIVVHDEVMRLEIDDSF
jgi:hypothetical protein